MAAKASGSGRAWTAVFWSFPGPLTTSTTPPGLLEGKALSQWASRLGLSRQLHP